MSSLLFDDHPLMCSPQLAAVFGNAEEAIILQQIHYWLKQTNNVQEDGHRWIYNSMADWLKQFPWIKQRKRLTKYFNDLEDRNLILVGRFNKSKFDKTKWYRINYDELNRLNDRMGQNDPIDKPKTDNRVGQDDPTNGSKQPNGVGQNDPTYTRDYSETTSKTTSDTDKDIDNARDAEIFAINGLGKNIAPSVAQKSLDYVQEAWAIDPGEPLREEIIECAAEFSDELVLWVLSYAKQKEVPSNTDRIRRYVHSTVEHFREQGVTTVEQAEKKAREHRDKIARKYGNHKPYGRTKRVEKLPDWAKDQHPQRDQKGSGDHHGDDGQPAANKKATADQLAETQRLMAKLHEKRKKHQQEQVDQDKQKIQQKRDEGRDKNGLADLLHSNG